MKREPSTWLCRCFGHRIIVNRLTNRPGEWMSYTNPPLSAVEPVVICRRCGWRPT